VSELNNIAQGKLQKAQNMQKTKAIRDITVVS